MTLHPHHTKCIELLEGLENDYAWYIEERGDEPDSDTSYKELKRVLKEKPVLAGQTRTGLKTIINNNNQQKGVITDG